MPEHLSRSRSLLWVERQKRHEQVTSGGRQRRDLAAQRALMLGRRGKAQGARVAQAPEARPRLLCGYATDLKDLVSSVSLKVGKASMELDLQQLIDLILACEERVR